MTPPPSAQPEVSAFTTDYYGRLPQAYRDADERADALNTGQNAYPLLRFLSLLLDQAGDLATVADDLAEGALTDPWRARPAWLPFLAAFYGIDARRYPADPARAAAGGDPDEPLRTAIAGASDARRPGSEAAILAAVRPLLTGTKAVEITRRDLEKLSYTLTVYEAQVPGGAAGRASLAALVRESAPAGLLGLLEVLGGWTWLDLDDAGWTWDDLAGPDAAPRTWDDVGALVPESAGLASWSAISRRTWAEIEAAGLTWTTLPRT